MVRSLIFSFLLFSSVCLAEDTIPFVVNPNAPTAPSETCDGFWMLATDGKTFVCISNDN